MQSQEQHVTWKTRPAPQQGGARYALFRVSEKGTNNLTIISEDLLGTWTHFHERRTRPCQGAGCEACRAGCPSREHFFILVESPKTRARAILQLTGRAAAPLVEMFDRFGTLRGVQLKAFRKPAIANGKIVVECAPHPSDTPLPEPGPDLKPILMTIWQLAQDHGPTTTIETHEEPRDAFRDRLRAYANGHTEKSA